MGRYRLGNSLVGLALTIPVISACAAPGVGSRVVAPYKPNTTVAEQARDADACAREIASKPIMTGREIAECMRRYGWREIQQHWYRESGTEATFAAELQECFVAPADSDSKTLGVGVLLAVSVRRCMESRGWVLRLGGGP